jgi:hypothetical protein
VKTLKLGLRRTFKELDACFRLLQNSQLPAVRRLEMSIEGGSQEIITGEVSDSHPFPFLEHAAEPPDWALPLTLASQLEHVLVDIWYRSPAHDLSVFRRFFGPANREGVLEICFGP